MSENGRRETTELPSRKRKIEIYFWDGRDRYILQHRLIMDDLSNEEVLNSIKKRARNGYFDRRLSNRDIVVIDDRYLMLKIESGRENWITIDGENYDIR